MATPQVSFDPNAAYSAAPAQAQAPAFDPNASYAPIAKMPTSRPSSSDEFDAAQQTGHYSEPAEKSGRPIEYLMQKPDESYTDFMHRAVEHGKTVTPEQIQDEADQPKKIVQSLARGAEYGLGGAAALTGIAETGSAVLNTVAKIPAVVRALPGVAKAAIEWAEANPMKAYLALQVAKELIPGGKGSTVTKIIHLVSGAED